MRSSDLRVGAFSTASGASPSSPPRAASLRAASHPRELSVLETRYPGLARTLTLLWGHPELTDFLSRVASGLEPRIRDIDPAAMAELMLLGALHRLICTTPVRASTDLHSIGRLAGTWQPAIQRG